MIDLTRPFFAARVAGLALIGFAAALAPSLALAAPNATAAPRPAASTPPQTAGGMAACQSALEYERTAARDDIPRQAAYDSAVAGLAANVRCNDPQMHLVNEGYLLSMRAVSEHELKIGDWNRDLTRANALLTQCTGFPGIARTKAATDCRTQIAGNQHVAGVFAAQAAAAAATPRPASATAPARPASPGPSTGSPSQASPRPPVALPTPPAPHRS